MKNQNICLLLLALVLAFFCVSSEAVSYASEQLSLTNETGTVSSQLVHSIGSDSQTVQFTTESVFSAVLSVLSIFGGATVAASIPVVRAAAKPIIPLLDALAFNFWGARNKS